MFEGVILCGKIGELVIPSSYIMEQIPVSKYTLK